MGLRQKRRDLLFCVVFPIHRKPAPSRDSNGKTATAWKKWKMASLFDGGFHLLLRLWKQHKLYAVVSWLRAPALNSQAFVPSTWLFDIREHRVSRIATGCTSNTFKTDGL